MCCSERKEDRDYAIDNMTDAKEYLASEYLKPQCTDEECNAMIDDRRYTRNGYEAVSMGVRITGGRCTNPRRLAAPACSES